MDTYDKRRKVPALLQASEVSTVPYGSANQTNFVIICSYLVVFLEFRIFVSNGIDNLFSLGSIIFVRVYFISREATSPLIR